MLPLTYGSITCRNLPAVCSDLIAARRRLDFTPARLYHGVQEAKMAKRRAKIVKVFIGRIPKHCVEYEDCKHYMTCHVDEGDRPIHGMSVQLKSRSESYYGKDKAGKHIRPKHPDLRRFVGRRVRITVETIG